MKRWIIAAAVAVAAVLVASIAIPGAWGTTYAAWNGAASVAATVSAGSWAPAAPDPAPSSGGISSGTPQTGLTTVDFYEQTPTSFCVNSTVTTTSTSPIEWRLRVDTKAIPFNGAEPSQVTNAVKISGPDANGILYYGGVQQSWAGPAYDAVNHNTPIVAGQSTTIKFCRWSGNASSVVAAGPTTYSTQSVLASGATQYNACVQTTVTGYSTFYVGFEIAYDWQQILNSATGLDPAVKAALLDKKVSNWSWQGSWSVENTGYLYKGHGTNANSNATVKAGQTLVVSSCV
ncbi:hypothetical protein [Leifsonia sp. Leaf264]|uniref:hypothetical protein n=1 Tax=Leifsonia sp. Leaf264 TaxID=1736314 RepID=UPI0006F92BC0|nr:hypothetical protein [Leifsonia sp. Leaf264]KQO99870.1 hypothetical protein ASF30_08325 [Leifsonia sp. Leaf264]